MFLGYFLTNIKSGCQVGGYLVQGNWISVSGAAVVAPLPVSRSPDDHHHLHWGSSTLFHTVSHRAPDKSLVTWSQLSKLIVIS